ncbi:hypothetical protein [Pantoea agglomerans]|uniref:hypothetical protein n=1 Tax=Enterobacter agglomerans TaxID=549 RepID=UPI0034CFD4EA
MISKDISYEVIDRVKNYSVLSSFRNPDYSKYIRYSFPVPKGLSDILSEEIFAFKTTGRLALIKHGLDVLNKSNSPIIVSFSDTINIENVPGLSNKHQKLVVGNMPSTNTDNTEQMLIVIDKETHKIILKDCCEFSIRVGAYLSSLFCLALDDLKKRNASIIL